MDIYIYSHNVYVGSTKGAFKNAIVTLEVVSHTKFIDLRLVYLRVKIKKNLAMNI